MRWKLILFLAAPLLAGHVMVQPLSGNDGRTDDPRRREPSTVQRVVALRSGPSRPAVCTGSIGDLVWDDRNADGIQDPSEPGIRGLRMWLWDPQQNVVSAATTDEEGRYLLTGICAGEYTIQFPYLPGELDPFEFSEPSPCHAGSDPARDSNCPGEPITLAVDDSQDLGIDFGFHYRPCESGIGDFVWNDANRNGIQDPGEPGLPRAVVGLIDADDMLLDATETDATGHYCFPPTSGTWRVIAHSTLPDSVPSPCEVGPDRAVDSDCDPAWVTVSGLDLGVDFGFYSEPQGGEGCSPGFWKQPQHFGWWPQPYAPADSFDAIFAEEAFAGKTLLEVLWSGGGGLNALGRHTVAALLNAASRDVSYDLKPGEVTSRFRDVYPGDNLSYEDLKDEFARYNEQFCPLGRPGLD